MSKSIKEKIIIAVVSVLLASGAISAFSNVFNAASKEDLEKAKKEAKTYTDTKLEDHETKDAIRYEQYEKNSDKNTERIEYLYLRELEETDRKLYLQELAKIEKAKTGYIPD